MSLSRPLLSLLPITLDTYGGTPVPPGAPPPAGYGAPGMAPMRRTSGKAITGLVLGILGLCIAWIPFVNFLAFITGILAIVFGFLGKKDIDNSQGMITGNGMAMAGIILGFLQLVLVVAVLAFLGSIWAEIMREIEESEAFALFRF